MVNAAHDQRQSAANGHSLARRRRRRPAGEDTDQSREGEDDGLTARAELDPDTLGRLAEEINRDHIEARSSCRRSVEHALRAGKRLVAAKDLVLHGEWGDWLARNCRFPARTARAYMRLAEHEAELGLDDPDRQDIADLTLSGALKRLAKPRAGSGSTPPPSGADGERDLAARLSTGRP
jgi:hypothetical protein